MADYSRLSRLPVPLLQWYRANRRILPWREDPRPYRVWVSEIMLQQTRVEAVLPYYERFLRELPDIPALAPGDYEAVKALPGIGEYTAGAICSIAFGLPTPAVDGNVLRVVCRITGDETPVDSPALKRRCREELAPGQSGATSTVSSASTGRFMGREATPKAQRACLPCSPNTSTSKSLRPLATCGCWVNSGVEAT